MLPQLLAAAVIGALSPVATLSTIMLLSSRRPVANVVACLIGWTVVLMALAAGLLQSPETPHWMQKLEHVRPAQALVIGMVLIAVGPADLVAYFSAVQALIGEAGLSVLTRVRVGRPVRGDPARRGRRRAELTHPPRAGRTHPRPADDRRGPPTSKPSERSPQMSDLIAIAYPDVATARQVAGRIGEAAKGKLLDVDDLVIIERREDGKIKLHQPSLAGVGALGGAAWGGLIGLLFLVPVFGMAVGAATGAVAGAMSDAGVDDNFMKELGDQLQPGTAALVGLVRNVNKDKVMEEIQVPGTLIHSSLTEEADAQLREALESAGVKQPA
jgi:uncharacterized membrane protein